MNFARAFLFGSQEHKGIDVKNPYFLKAISHIIVSLNEAACNSSTGQLVNLSTAMCKCELFQVKMVILFTLTSTIYNKKTFSSYMPFRWYKSPGDLCQILFYKLKKTKIMLTSKSHTRKMSTLCKLLLTTATKNADLKSLSFVQNIYSTRHSN